MKQRALWSVGFAVVAGALLLAQNQRRAAEPALLMDGHVHITTRAYFEGIDPWTPQPVGPFDYARARAGGASVVIENLGPYGYEDYNAIVKQVGRLLETFHRTVEAHRDKMELALSSADVRRIVRSGKMAVLLGIEGGWDQDGDIDILRLWYRLGVRTIVFSSHQTNAFTDSASAGGEHWGGINARGRQLIEEMNRLGMLVDITHATPAAQRQIIAASRAPVVASHTAIQLSDGGAGMPQDILKALVAKGGMVGLTGGAQLSPAYAEWAKDQQGLGNIDGLSLQEVIRPKLPLVRQRAPDFDYWDAFDNEMRTRWRRYWSKPFLLPSSAPLPTVDVFADYVAKVVAIAGPEHVGIGLDLFQGRAYFSDFSDASGYSRMAAALRRHHVPDSVLGPNWLRVLDAARVDVPASRVSQR
jgi:membrane dipeptidase